MKGCSALSSSHIHTAHFPPLDLCFLLFLKYPLSWSPLLHANVYVHVPILCSLCMNIFHPPSIVSLDVITYFFQHPYLTDSNLLIHGVLRGKNKPASVELLVK